jgi:hypothetical protein
MMSVAGSIQKSPEKSSPMSGDFHTLPGGLFAIDRTVEIDGITWFFGVARCKGYGPAFVGLWRGLPGTGFRLPNETRPLEAVRKHPGVEHWLAQTYGADVACMHIPSRQRCYELIVADTPYKN